MPVSFNWLRKSFGDLNIRAVTWTTSEKKQPPEAFYKKSCSQRFRNIDSETYIKWVSHQLKEGLETAQKFKFFIKGTLMQI